MNKKGSSTLPRGDAAQEGEEKGRLHEGLGEGMGCARR